MRATLTRLVDSRRFAAAAAAVAAMLAGLVGLQRPQQEILNGDEGTFVAMAASLARDGDLRFQAADVAWANAQSGRPPGLILQVTAAGVSYSKPIVYPLVAAPFYGLLGERGLLLLHVVLLGGALAAARAALVRRAGGARAGETLLCFAFASVVVPHLAWRMTETLQVSLALAGLALTLGGELPGDGSTADGRSRLGRRSTRLAGAALLALLVALREPNALVAAVPLLAAASARRWRRAAEMALVMAAVYGAVVAFTVALAGAPNPYKTWRSTFDAATGYPAGPDGAAALARFDTEANRATSDLGAVPRLDPSRTLYSALYFVVGRHSGLLPYFPAALVLLWAAFAVRRAERHGARDGPALDGVGRAAFAGFVATALFYLVWWPENYFGGSTHLGNRYLLAAYPCLLFVPRTLPSRRALAAGWLVALGFGLSALLSTRATSALGAGSQSHAHAGLFRLLPYESTASAIDGRRDRYWAGDFVRFVDPFPRADATSFELAAGAPAAEAEIATAWSGTPLRFLVVASASDATLVLSDWLGSERFRLAPDANGRSGGVVELRPSPAWRLHRFWWPAASAYRARLLRFRLDAPESSTARIRYLGRARLPDSGFAHEVAGLSLPDAARAGARSELELRVTNRGGWSWSSSESLPVLVGVRLARLAADDRIDSSVPAVESRVELPRPVEPGEELSLRLPVAWPQASGRYRLTVDLVLEDVAWFAERVGAPLGEAIVTVSE